MEKRERERERERGTPVHITSGSSRENLTGNVNVSHESLHHKVAHFHVLHTLYWPRGLEANNTGHTHTHQLTMGYWVIRFLSSCISFPLLLMGATGSCCCCCCCFFLVKNPANSSSRSGRW